MRESSRFLWVIGACGFAGAFSARATDPMVNAIAGDLLAPVALVALLSSAYTLPYGLGQPFLGPMGDSFGKSSVLKGCMLLLTVALTACSLAPGLDMLFGARLVAGFAAGGVIPVALAMIGDRFPVAGRQVAIARFLGSAMIGQLAGVTVAGVLADLVGWRGGLWATAIAAGAATAILFANLEGSDRPEVARFNLREITGRYGVVLANPRAAICFATVFAEALCVYGVQPFIPEILQQRGGGGATQAGLVIAGLGIGGLLFTLLVSRIVSLLGPFLMMAWGGAIAGVGLVILAVSPDWRLKMGGFLVIGFGFFMMHNALQSRAVELAPTARGSAVALHAFSFFIGQAVAPVLFAVLLPRLGAAGVLTLDGLVIGGLGVTAAVLLRRIDRREGLV